jgi:GNAT superfamily N-acetyltransferase
MRIQEVNSQKDIQAFHQLPFKIYKNDPNWIPHLRQDVEKIFDPKKNKIWRKGKAKRWILLNDANEVVGRIAAWMNGNSKEHPSGCGFFESINDKNVAFKLFDTAKEWLLSKGATQMDGPINFGENHQYWGLIIENFNEPPYYLQNYNPEYYVNFFVEYGFQIYFKQEIFFRKITDPLQEKFTERAEQLKNDPLFKVGSIDMSRFESYAEEFRTIYNRAWANRQSGFSEMSKSQAISIFKGLKPVVDPTIAYFAYYDNRPIGMYIQLPEINQIFRHVHGNLNWWGKLKFLYHKKKKTVNRCFGMVFGIDPDFQGRGVEGIIFQYMADTTQKEGHYKDLVITWIGDFNPKMISIVKGLGAQKFREMATYRYLFDRTAEFKRKPMANLGKTNEE